MINQILDYNGFYKLCEWIKKTFVRKSTVDDLTARVAALEKAIETTNTNINNLPTAAQNDAKYIRKDQNDSTTYTITAAGFYKAV